MGFIAPMRPRASWRSSTGYVTSRMMNVVKKAFRRMVRRGRWRRRPVARSARPLASAFRRSLAQQPTWPDDQDEDQHAEYDGLGPARVEQEIGCRRQEANDHAAQERAGHIPYAAHDGRRERVETVTKALKEPGGVVVETVQGPGRPCQRAAQ